MQRNWLQTRIENSVAGLGWLGLHQRLQDSLLLADPDWIISVGRLAVALLAMLAIYLDPTQPAEFLWQSQIVLGFYCAFALLLVMFRWITNSQSLWHLIPYAIDALVLGWLAMLTSELTSPFSSFLPFILPAMALRWGALGALVGVTVLEVELVIIGVPDLEDGNPELNIFIVRSACYLVIALMVAYLGAYRQRTRQRLTELADWPSPAITGAGEVWLEQLLRHGATVLGSSMMVVAWRDHDEQRSTVAIWRNGSVHLVRMTDDLFWQRHDPKPFDYQANGNEARRGLRALLAGAPTLSQELDVARIKTVSRAGFSGVRCLGWLFVIDSTCRPEESGEFTEVVARRLGSEFERMALIREHSDAALSQERERLARDLHDSVLQDLAAANLTLRAVQAQLPEALSNRLAHVAAIVAGQQRRIRHFVEDHRFGDQVSDTALDRAMRRHSEDLVDQWDCRIELKVAPDDVQVPGWFAGELNQIVSEATANAVRHGSATHLRVDVTRNREQLVLDIVDNGCGLKAAGQKRPTSLFMRTESLGGSLAVTRAKPGLGLRIALPIPGEVG
jgi:signal transduction histidine kinase